MRSSAEFFAINNSIVPDHFINLDGIRIFFPKSPRDSTCTCMFFIFLMHLNSKIARECFIYKCFHIGNLFGRHFFSVGKIKSKSLGGDIRSCLSHMVSENLAESSQHEMAGGMEGGGLIGGISQASFKFSSGSGSREFLMFAVGGLKPFVIDR